MTILKNRLAIKLHKKSAERFCGFLSFSADKSLFPKYYHDYEPLVIFIMMVLLALTHIPVEAKPL